MEEDQDLAVRAHSFKDYIEENRKIKDILSWTWTTFISPKNKKTFKKILLLVVISNLLGVLTSYYAIRSIIDGIINNNDTVLVNGFIALVIILIGARLIGFWRNILREHFFADFGSAMNDRISRLYFEKSLGMHTNEDRLLNESNISKGNERLNDMVSVVVIDGPDLFGGLSIAFLALWFIQPVVALIITFMIALYMFWGGLINYKIMTEGYPIEKMWRYLNRLRKEKWKNIERVKTNSKEDEELKRLSGCYDQAIGLDLKLWISVLKLWCVRGIASISIFIGALIYGLWQVRIGNLSPGWIYPIFTLGFQVFDTLWRINELERRVHYNLWSAGILKEALSLPVGLIFKDNAIELPKDSPCRIEFDSVFYRFKDDSSPLVLSDISFTVEPEEKVAIVGTSGAGKSTLMKLLLRAMDPSEGRIIIDGKDLKDIDLASWLSVVGYISQAPQVWNDTIRGNALYGISENEKELISDEFLWEQARGVQVDFGERLVNGLDTVVGERGVKLSGGQNQRLMILSAIMKNPRFMIIDEATSSLDSSTEKLVQAGLERALSRNCGALIIAHRLSTVRRLCNKFIVLEPVNGSGGKIVGMAKSFEELYEVCPQFRKLADDQEIKI